MPTSLSGISSPPQAFRTLAPLGAWGVVCVCVCVRMGRGGGGEVGGGGLLRSAFTKLADLTFV